MRRLMDWAHRLAHAMHIIAGAMLVGMVVVVIVDVMTGLLFRATGGAVDITFYGGVELVKYSLLIMVLFSLPYSVARGQVIVDLFTENLPERIKGILSAVYIFGFGLLGLGMAIGFTENALDPSNHYQTTQDLQIPLYLFQWVAAFGAAVLALRGFLVAYEYFLESGKRP
ncbi:MAG: TRAP transporter small permease subunit [Rhodospirillaceae bacterium]